MQKIPLLVVGKKPNGKLQFTLPSINSVKNYQIKELRMESMI